MVDDGVFYRPTNLSPKMIEDVLSVEKNLCVSLRLGTNTIVQNYLTGELQQPFDKYGFTPTLHSLLSFKWGLHAPNTNNGYLFSWDCTFWNSQFLLTSIGDSKFGGPRGMESVLSGDNKLRQKAMTFHPNMVIPQFSNYVVNSVNAVQTDPVPCGKFYSHTSVD